MKCHNMKSLPEKDDGKKPELHPQLFTASVKHVRFKLQVVDPIKQWFNSFRKNVIAFIKKTKRQPA